MCYPVFTTRAQSYTGSLLYSDSYSIYNRARYTDQINGVHTHDPHYGHPVRTYSGEEIGGMPAGIRHDKPYQYHCRKIQESSVSSKAPLLNKLAMIPIFGILVGTFRVVLAIIHMIGHALAALVKWDRGHLCHVVKGGAELLRGLIDILPIIGRIFEFIFHKMTYSVEDHEQDYSMPPREVRFSFFLVKIHNPDRPDGIDKFFYQSRNA